MALSPGTRLGPYEITGPLGAGGMGEVYRATDTKLGREVAIKTLPSALANEPDRLARFEREAKLLAALNHSNIGAIYGLDEHEGAQFLAMELIEGETLEEKLKAGPLPVDDALRLALQIAEALEAAHDKGVVHRDLKPANVMVTRDSVVKVLDFGLAKAFSGNPNEASPAHSPALSVAMTQQGLILGTAGYMSPEQASGQATDQRADIWAFGVVLYEMLTGLPLFSGESVPHILADVLRTEPNWNRLPKSLHPRVKLLLERCLNKKVRNRYHSMADVRVDIEEVLSDPQGMSAAASAAPRGQRAWTPWAAFAVAVLGMSWLAIPTVRHLRETSPPVTRLLMGLEPAESLLGSPAASSQARPTRTAIAWSPDGRTLVFGGDSAGVQQLYVRRLDQLQATPLAGTEGAISPFFSPDGGTVGFWAAGALKKIALSGGPAVTLCETPVIGSATWADGDVIFFDDMSSLAGGGISKVAGAGGRPELVASPDRAKGEYSYRLPHALPGGKALLLTRTMTNELGDATIVVWSLATGQPVLLTDGADARYVPTGHLVFARQGALLAAPFDVTALRLTGPAVGVVDDVMQAFNAPTAPLRTGAAQFDVSPTGSLAYAPGGLFSEDIRSLVWVDRAGTVTPLALPLRAYWGPRLAPDGQRLTFYVYEGAGGRAWITDLRSGTSTPITETGSIYYPHWSPDGARVAYSANGNLFWRQADGSGEPVRLTTSSNTQAPSAWSPDGRELVFVDQTSAGQDIWVLPLGEGGDAPRPWLSTRFNEAHPDWSPDGRWIAYDSDESGRSEVYVQPYPGPGARYAVSRDGGSAPVWARDGRELFYLARTPDQQVTLMTVPVTTTPGFSTGTPTKLFQGRFITSGSSRSYDVDADSQRFIMVQPQEQAALPVAQIVVVQNWIEELKRLAPTE